MANVPRETPDPEVETETNEQLRARLPRNPGESESDYHARLEEERVRRAAERGALDVDDVNA